MDRSLILSLLCFLFFSCTDPGSNTPSDYPAVLDKDLVLTLVAEDPEVMTPIGIAIDEADRVFVLESHTHTPPEDYNGPDSDQVKVLTDLDGDGMMDSVNVFASGIVDGMNMTFGPDGELYVVSSQAVTRYPDRDGDGIMDGPEVVVRLTEPESVYDHAALLGIAATPDGWLYISRGNTGSKKWKLEGTDQSYVEGYGDGGNIVRCRLDGSEVEEVATGFWNPFDLIIDETGRVLVIDNDPDSRGPNRLVDVVQGGDYGYKSLYGGSGIHPFLAWDGELPGTVPYVTGVGEAPSGLFDARLSSLPGSYEDNVLVTIWEESKIVAIHLTEQDNELVAEHRDILQGGQDFRPVAFAANSRGEVYFTDWVVREYPNHGKGKLWKLASVTDSEKLSPQPQYASFKPGESMSKRMNLASISSLNRIDELEHALLSGDAHLQAIARDVLKAPVFRNWLEQSFESEHEDLRIQVALVLESLDIEQEDRYVKSLLEDDSDTARHVGLLWAARKGVGSALSQVHDMLADGLVEPELFDAYLAAVKHLQPGFVNAYKAQSVELARSIERTLPDGYLLDIIKDRTQSDAIRALAFSRLDDVNLDLQVLEDALVGNGPALQEAAIYYLLENRIEEGVTLLEAALDSPTLTLGNKELAILALSWYPEEKTTALPESIRDYVAIWRQPVEFEDSRPDQEAEWVNAIEEEGNAERGQLVFYSGRAQCATCHVYDGWGGVIGPDLSNIGRSKSKEQILGAILDPSAEIAPEWQGWYVQTEDGSTVFGRQIDVGLHRVEIMKMDGSFEVYSDVKGYGIAPISLMPDGLEAQLSVRDMKDLMAFLTRK